MMSAEREYLLSLIGSLEDEIRRINAELKLLREWAEPPAEPPSPDMATLSVYPPGEEPSIVPGEQPPVILAPFGFCPICGRPALMKTVEDQYLCGQGHSWPTN